MQIKQNLVNSESWIIQTLSLVMAGICTVKQHQIFINLAVFGCTLVNSNGSWSMTSAKRRKCATQKSKNGNSVKLKQRGAAQISTVIGVNLAGMTVKLKHFTTVCIYHAACGTALVMCLCKRIVTAYYRVVNDREFGYGSCGHCHGICGLSDSVHSCHTATTELRECYRTNAVPSSVS